MSTVIVFEQHIRGARWSVNPLLRECSCDQVHDITFWSPICIIEDSNASPAHRTGDTEVPKSTKYPESACAGRIAHLNGGNRG